MQPLFRYFSKEHASDFVQKGTVLFRSLSYFRDYEDIGVRADEHEGTLVHQTQDGIAINKLTSGESLSLQYRFESTVKEDEIFVYCMSTELSPEIAQRFGADVAIEILDLPKFLNCLRAALSLRRRFRVDQLVYEDVRYYDWHEPPIVDWALPERIAMRKPRSFSWQMEYRFAVPIKDAFRLGNVKTNLVPIGSNRLSRANAHPQQFLNLGNLSKICKVHQMRK
jgi:hypothetical protein